MRGEGILQRRGLNQYYRSSNQVPGDGMRDVRGRNRDFNYILLAG